MYNTKIENRENSFNKKNTLIYGDCLLTAMSIMRSVEISKMIIFDSILING